MESNKTCDGHIVPDYLGGKKCVRADAEIDNAVGGFDPAVGQLFEGNIKVQVAKGPFNPEPRTGILKYSDNGAPVLTTNCHPFPKNKPITFHVKGPNADAEWIPLGEIKDLTWTSEHCIIQHGSVDNIEAAPDDISVYYPQAAPLPRSWKWELLTKSSHRYDPSAVLISSAFVSVLNSCLLAISEYSKEYSLPPFYYKMLALRDKIAHPKTRNSCKQADLELLLGHVGLFTFGDIKNKKNFSDTILKWTKVPDESKREIEAISVNYPTLPACGMLSLVEGVKPHPNGDLATFIFIDPDAKYKYKCIVE